MNTNNYYNEIRNEIGKEFGLEALGYNAPLPALSTRQAQYLNAKYPSAEALSMRPSDKALEIAKRYGRLTVLWRNSQTR
jgi:hypothetical protein